MMLLMHFCFVFAPVVVADVDVENDVLDLVVVVVDVVVFFVVLLLLLLS